MLTSNDSTKQEKSIPIFAGSIRIGSVKDGAFLKTIHGSRHILRFPIPSIAFDRSTLDAAMQAGAHKVIVTDADDDGAKYTAEISHVL